MYTYIYIILPKKEGDERGGMKIGNGGETGKHKNSPNYKSFFALNFFIDIIFFSNLGNIPLNKSIIGDTKITKILY